MPWISDTTHMMYFTTNSLRNTTVSVADDRMYYEIVTQFWHPHLTKISKLDKDARQMLLVAEIDREPGREVRIRMGGEHGAWVSLTEFLKWDSDKRGGTWMSPSGTEYRWKSHKSRLQLVQANDKNDVPVAKYVPYTRHLLVFRMDRHPALEVREEVFSFMDQLSVSYLLVEGSRRAQRLKRQIVKK